jgi:hypothetical protein
LLRDSATNFTDANGHGLCFVTQGPLTTSDTSEATRRFVAQKRAGIEQMLTRRIQRAVDEGELAPDTPAVDLGRFYTAIVLGMALLAQH